MLEGSKEGDTTTTGVFDGSVVELTPEGISVGLTVRRVGSREGVRVGTGLVGPYVFVPCDGDANEGMKVGTHVLLVGYRVGSRVFKKVAVVGALVGKSTGAPVGSTDVVK